MPTAVRAIPEGYHSVTPSLAVEGASKLIDFLKQAFHAQQLELFTMPDGRIAHAVLKIGDSRVMMAEATPEWPAMPSSMVLYMEDMDSVYRRALQAGETSIREPADQFYGDRSAVVRDPCGNVWTLATHKEDVSAEEMRKRMAQQGSQS